MPEGDATIPPVPESKVVSKKRTRPSAVWIIPIVAAIAGVWVAATRILSEGPEITITLPTAEGLEAGKSTVHYNGVDVGKLTAIRLSKDHKRVVATARMEPDTEGFLVDDTTFWIVSPRISGATVTGLGTLISGSYVGMGIGESKTPRRDFVGLDKPPVVSGDTPGRFFQLKTTNLGSLDYGTPIYFRRLKVGEVASYALDDDGRALTIKVFVNTPYDRYVNSDTRFWQASGIDLSLTANGLSVQTQSLLSILVGGIAFGNPSAGADMPPALEEAEFELFDDRVAAFKLPDRDPQTYVVKFTESVRGLTPGAPVEFRGIPVGQVLSVDAQVDAKTFQFSAPVKIVLDAQRLGVKIVDLPPGVDLELTRRQLIESLVEHGVRAQLRTGNLLTGAMFVSFDVFPDVAPATVDWSHDPVELPTMPGELQAIEASLEGIITKLDQIPFKAIGDDVQGVLQKLDKIPYEAIGQDLRKAIVELDRTMVSARGTLDNADRLIAPGSVLDTDLESTLEEVRRAARGLRLLLDYLERHPEALIRGKTGEAK